jgi:GTPase Era involved in 16S rRNA processing
MLCCAALWFCPVQSMVSEQPERFFVSEIIREQIFVQYDQEIPYSCQVRLQDVSVNVGRELSLTVCR